MSYSIDDVGEMTSDFIDSILEGVVQDAISIMDISDLYDYTLVEERHEEMFRAAIANKDYEIVGRMICKQVHRGVGSDQREHIASDLQSYDSYARSSGDCYED